MDHGHSLKLAVPAFVLMLTLILAIVILPEGCSLFSNEGGPFMCHTIPPSPSCCTDKLTVNYARAIAIIGIGIAIGIAVFLNRSDSGDITDPD